jgi:creatinine amidohydrolase/Fe(II)-dependent formamide hydrolase-like protein
MLAITPDLVHLERAVPESGRPAEHFARTGSTGNPAMVTAATGAALLGAMVDDIVALLRQSFG